jgi:hypothetical protein
MSADLAHVGENASASERTSRALRNRESIGAPWFQVEVFCGGFRVTVDVVNVRVRRRFERPAVVAALVVLSVACGGSHSNTAPGVAVSSSTTEASPTSAGVSAKKITRRVRVTASTRTATTVAGHTRAATAPTTIGLGGLVVPAVPPGGAAPATLPSPSPTATIPATDQPHTTTTTVKPFDPSQSIDLSGTPGVTLAQQAAAEALVRDTLRNLPRFADQSAAYAAGYRTIGDAFTGDEHWVNWAYVADRHIFDSMRPESLVYNTRVPGHPVLEAAMYMLAPGSRFTDIPALFQSPLTQFHVHNNICFAQTSDPLQKVFAGLTDSNGICPPGTTLAGNVPMLHVWIVKNPCGPFAALSGIAAGQVPPGQAPNCDTAHAGVL